MSKRLSSRSFYVIFIIIAICVYSLDLSVAYGTTEFHSHVILIVFLFLSPLI